MTAKEKELEDGILLLSKQGVCFDLRIEHGVSSWVWSGMPCPDLVGICKTESRVDALAVALLQLKSHLGVD